MKKTIQYIAICFLLCSALWFTSVCVDRHKLNTDMIRLHVVANSDSERDQEVKLRVKDAIVNALQYSMQSIRCTEDAKQFIQEQKSYLEDVANDTLQKEGVNMTACVSLQKECFDVRQYDTFSLPSGVYESLRITIGEGKGKNWWCVVFPTLCAGKTQQTFSDTAVGSGFGNPLTEALQQNQPYEIRFFFLDCIGKIQNFFFCS